MGNSVGSLSKIYPFGDLQKKAAATAEPGKATLPYRMGFIVNKRL